MTNIYCFLGAVMFRFIVLVYALCLVFMSDWIDFELSRFEANCEFLYMCKRKLECLCEWIGCARVSEQFSINWRRRSSEPIKCLFVFCCCWCCRSYEADSIIWNNEFVQGHDDWSICTIFICFPAKTENAWFGWFETCTFADIVHVYMSRRNSKTKSFGY